MKDPRENEILIDDFFDNNQKLKLELISDTNDIKFNVKNLGLVLQEELNYPKKPNEKKTKKYHKEFTLNQLRKYYDSFLKIFYSQVPEDTKKIQLLMLKANCEYSAERNEHRRFSMFMNNRINIIIKKSGEDFNRYLEAFKLHFEALVGYYPRKKEN
ncbi:MAG: type III-A CRISPR-associated protein Csm2 [Melioribacteraceae bacterium]